MKNKNTYSLILNADAEDKGRSIFETAVYSTVAMATALSVWAFATGGVMVPGMDRVDKGNEAGFTIKAPAAEQPIVIASRN